MKLEMDENDINNAETMQGGRNALLASRYRIVRQLGAGGMGAYGSPKNCLGKKLLV